MWFECFAYIWSWLFAMKSIWDFLAVKTFQFSCGLQLSFWSYLNHNYDDDDDHFNHHEHYQHDHHQYHHNLKS